MMNSPAQSFTLIVSLFISFSFFLTLSAQNIPYKQKKAQIIIIQDSLKNLHNNSDNDKSVAEQKIAKKLIEIIYNEIIPYWYGRPWAFHGATQNPDSGSIACGYFVTTILRDSGFNLERVKLAQQASEIIIRSLVDNSNIRKYRNMKLSRMLEDIKNDGAGVYVVGLDIHTGFIVNDGTEIWFIHSSYQDPFCVIKEKAGESFILGSSAYRVTGNLTVDTNLLSKWVNKIHIGVQKNRGQSPLNKD
ncbi:MAG: hypothetical protein K9G57_17200 [Ignavibacteriales bacterium]|nr:hypothetical protein [Ignavibacteriales bacterium]MCF8438589.1 hypothetical protein [Ignavibacteriales bacterium]